MNLRQQLEAQIETLAPQAAKSRSLGRVGRAETRFGAFSATAIGSSTARRSDGSNTRQVLRPTGDHYRTRLTHAGVSHRVRSRRFSACEELTEAIALGRSRPPRLTPATRDRQPHAGRLQRYEQSLRIMTLENEGRGLNLTWEVRDGIAKHSKGKSGAPIGLTGALRSSTIEGQIMRVADLIAYVNHDIDDATRAGLLRAGDLPPEPVRVLGNTSSARIGSRGTDVVTETLAGGMTEIRMSAPVLQAVLDLRSFLFDAVYENAIATAEFKKASGILSGLWEKVRERADDFLDRHTIEHEGLDAAVRDFIAGMRRYAARLFEGKL